LAGKAAICKTTGDMLLGGAIIGATQ
jgi:hypothetical protein